jgi:hypothetical protein
MNRSLSLDYYRDAGLQRWVDDYVAAHKIEAGAGVLVGDGAVRRQIPAGAPRGRLLRRRLGQMAPVRRPEILADELAVPPRGAPAAVLRAPGGARLRRLAVRLGAGSGPVPRARAGKRAPRSASSTTASTPTTFRPDTGHANPYPAGERAVVFTGAMDYWPNVDAVQWFAPKCSRQLRARLSRPALLHRRRASAQAVRSAGQAADGVSVTGTVPDVRPYIAHAQVAVAPLRIARGIQNKVLEAMAMATPVVVSPQALEGIDAEPGHRTGAGRRRRRFRRRRQQPAPSRAATTWGAPRAPKSNANTAGRATWPASGSASNVPETAARRRRTRHPPRPVRARAPLLIALALLAPLVLYFAPRARSSRSGTAPKPSPTATSSCRSACG